MLFIALTSIGAAQSSPVRLELGFDGHLVAERWNPLRLITRDQPASKLSLSIDYGSLREGERLITYSAEISAGSGLYVFQDDIYIPNWRSITWNLSTAERVLASGSLDRRGASSERLTLLVSSQPSRWLDTLDGERIVTFPANLLPQRLAAYDGVKRLIIDGSTAMPSPQSLLAASAAGAITQLVEPLPASYAPLLELSSSEPQRLGAGWLLRTSSSDKPDLATLDLSKAIASISSSDMVAIQPHVPQVPFLAGVSLYGLVIILLLRFAGHAGIVTALVLSIPVSFATLSSFQIDAAETHRERSLSISAGGLAHNTAAQGIVSLRGGTLELSMAVYPNQISGYHQHVRRDTSIFSMTAPRWSQILLIAKPSLSLATFGWQHEQLHNSGRTTLNNVYIKGYGPQQALAAGMSMQPQTREDGQLSDVYHNLLEHLPIGTAIASSNNQIFLALPDSITWNAP